MNNVWVQTEMEQVAWCATVPRSTNPVAILDLLGEIARLASEQEVATLDAPALRVDLEQRFRSERRIDCGLIRGRSPSARCAWFNDQDDIIEEFTTDLGTVLRSLQPEPGAIWTRHMSSWSPVAIRGGVTEISDREPCSLLTDIHLGIATFTDIWFPFVLGIAHLSHDGERFFDNRDLARRHTPRLNRFVSSVADLIIASGGTWAIDDGVIAPQMRPWVSERGILLDGPIPPMMPPELVDVPWRPLDD